MHEPRAHSLSSAEEGCIALPCGGSPCVGGCERLVSLDYDGTLRPEGTHGVSPALQSLLHELRGAGVRWGINTGRSLQKLAGELALLHVMPDFICTCERYVYMADARGHLQPAAEHNARCHRANLDLRRSLLSRWLPALERLRSLYPALRWEIAHDDPLSIEAEDSPTLDTLMPHLSGFADGEVSIQRAGRFMRLSVACFSKGSALRFVQQAWQVDESRLFLMGDGHNDLDAFRAFPRAYCAAPASAHPDVLLWLRKHGGHIHPDVETALHQWIAPHCPSSSAHPFGGC